jgi:hypothetical protein
MSMKLKILCGFALVAAILTVGWQRNAVSRTRAENEALRQKNALVGSIVAVQPQNLNDEIEALQAANHELPKLRNEVRKLREEKREVEKLRAENERLSAALKAAPKMVAPPLSEAEGFVLKEKWSHAGFATPEATVQTFFWAIANKDVGALAECMTGDARKSMEREMQRSLADGGKRFEEQFEPLAQMQGFRIAEKKQVSETKIELGIQAASGGQAMPMALKLVNGEWKLAN